MKQKFHTIHIYSHLFIYSIGYLQFIKVIVRLLLKNDEKYLDVYEWVMPFFFLSKKTELLIYIVALPFLFLFFMIGFYYYSRRLVNINLFINKLYSLRYLFIYYLFIILFNFFLLTMKGLNSFLSIPVLILWLILFLLPSLNFKLNVIEYFDYYIKRRENQKKYIYGILLILSLVSFFYTFKPFVFDELKIINEFMDVPQITLRSNGDQLTPEPITVIENIKSINNNFEQKKLSREVKYYLKNKQINYLKTYLENNWVELSEDEKSLLYILKNGFEFRWQVLSRFVLHHHNHVYGPVNEYSLGKNIDEIYIQYGYLNMLTTKKIMEWVGGINFQNYFKVWYSYYYLYYLFFLIFLIIYFKKIEYALLTFVLTVAIIQSYSFQWLFVGPGINPVRHFFDISSILLFLLYLRKNKFYLLIITLILAIIGVLNNNYFGLIFLITIIGTLSLFILFEKKNKYYCEFFCLIISAAIGCFIVHYQSGPDYAVSYFSDGLLGMPLNSNLILLLFVISFIILFLVNLLFDKNNFKADKYMIIILSLYSLGLLLYFVWCSDDRHFRVFAPVFLLTIVSIIKYFFNHNSFKKYEDRSLFILILLASIISISTANTYRKSINDFNKVFDDHQTYKWDMKRASFTSTMNPQFFSDSIELINKYSQGNGIYIISKYDFFIPFLAGKYSKMPFFDIASYLFSEKELRLNVEKINQDKPEYLYVDSDIHPDKNNIISIMVPVIGRWHHESILRMKRLILLEEIFLNVAADYKAIDFNGLLTVYKRVK